MDSKKFDLLKKFDRKKFDRKKFDSFAADSVQQVL